MNPDGRIGVGVADLRAGGRYLHINGGFIRIIDQIDGDTVHWHDSVGPGICRKQTFIRRCGRVLPDDLADTASPGATAIVPSPAIDRHITNQLLSITLTLQNQIVVWAQSLKQTADYHQAILTPAQREAAESIISDCLDLENNLERHRVLLSGGPHPLG